MNRCFRLLETAAIVAAVIYAAGRGIGDAIARHMAHPKL